MYCKNKLEDEEYTVPLRFKSQEERNLSRSPNYSAFERGDCGTYHILTFSQHNEQKVLLLESSTYTVGRHEANSIILESATASRHHAYLIRIFDPTTKQHHFRIFDGDFNGKRSRNGLWINGKRRSAHTIKDQDIISFGEDFSIHYHVVSDRNDSRLNTISSITELPIHQLQSELPPGAQLFPKSTQGGSLVSLNEHREKDSTRQSEMELARLSSFAELAPHAIIETDLDGKITYYNPMASIQFQGLTLGETSSVTDGLFDHLQQGRTQTFVREIVFSGCIYEQSVHCILQSQIIRSYFTEITHRKNLEESLYETKTRYTAAVNGANDGIWDWDLLTNEIYFSTRWKTIIGCDEQDIANAPESWFSRIHPHDLDRVHKELELHCSGSIPHFESEYRILNKDGNYRWVRARGLAIRNEQNQAIRIAGSQADIHEHYIAKTQLAHDAMHDGMTGLPNRNLFMDRLKQTLKHLSRNKDQKCAVLFLDLDRFKLINDSLGHSAGDELLIEVAHRLKSCLRDEDTVARLGGDEFVILLNSINQVNNVLETANKILSILRTAINIQEHEIFTSASIGIVIADHNAQSPEDLLQNADTAMYQAKHLGKNQYTLYGSNMRGQSIQKLTLENDLQRALKNDEFYLEYQPIVDLESKEFISFEALIRWQHPMRGLISPADFIPVAEDTGLIISIGWWVLEKACRQLREWTLQHSEQPQLSVSVNISSRQFLDANFIDRIQTIICQNQIAENALKLEITEGVAMHNPQMVAKKFDQLQKLGIRLMMDDFGTGYSSLNYLKSFSIDTLKIDRSFVDPMLEENGIEIIKTIINLAHNLNMDVVAEGVESKAQAQRLAELGCEYAQGYYFSKPQSVESISTLIRGQQ